MTDLRYRPEIDGLRAVAVLGVVFYHAGFGAPGGYVGVDVFFVISGFLITRILLRSLETGTFSLLDFWARRVRRIFPAAGAMVALVLLAGVLLLDPLSLVHLGWSAFAQLTLASNFYFWQDVGYFAEASKFKILLHTWSLAVEEQFYLVFPILLVLVYKFFRRWLLGVLAGLTLVMLAVGIYGIQSAPETAFYWLHFRAWELLFGALLAVGETRLRSTRWQGEAAAFGGLLLILGAMGWAQADRPLSVILPIVGTVLVIAGCSVPGTLTGKLLAVWPLVFVGQISYSLYLWHWPLLAFAENLLIEVIPAVKAGLMFAAFLLAVLSWRFVENPFRQKVVFPGRRAILGFGLAASFVLLLAGGSLILWQGLPGRFTSEMQVVLQDIEPYLSPQMGEDGKPGWFGAPRPAGDARPDFVLWGDSHARVLYRLVDAKAKQHELVGVNFFSDALPPVTGVWRLVLDQDEESVRTALDINRQVFEYILAKRPPHVILSARWTAYCGVASPYQRRTLRAGWMPMARVVDQRGTDPASVTPETACATLRRHLDLMVDQLSAVGVKLWILQQVPSTDNPNTARHFALAKRFPWLNSPDQYTVTLEEHRERQAVVDKALAGMESPFVTVIDLTPWFYVNGPRLKVYGERTYYRDDHHLAFAGTETYLGVLFDALLTDIAHARPAVAGN